MADNSTIRPPKGVADNSLYPNQEAWPTTPVPDITTGVWESSVLSGLQKE